MRISDWSSDVCSSDLAMLPDQLAWRVARLERAGLFIVIGVLFLLPFLAAQVGVTLDVAGALVWAPVETLAAVIMAITGHGDAGRGIGDHRRIREPRDGVSPARAGTGGAEIGEGGGRKGERVRGECRGGEYSK